MNSFKQHLDNFNQHLTAQSWGKAPASLYQPIDYILALGGKRIRPVLVMMSNELFGTMHPDALHAATAVELFHNFSLMHDDIMDNAPLRRGQATIHEKFGNSTAILSGDVTLVLAYEQLMKVRPEIQAALISLFNKTAIEVCEGQQWDMEFENRQDVTVPQYMNMIELKTSVLLGCAMQMGAIVAGSSAADATACYQFGKHLGVAFQLQDDILDSFGNPETFGKQVGGDILANKKTFLLLNAMEMAEAADRQELNRWLAIKETKHDEKVAAVKALFEKLGVRQLAEAQMQEHLQLAFANFDKVSTSAEQKAPLIALANELMLRTV